LDEKDAQLLSAFNMGWNSNDPPKQDQKTKHPRSEDQQSYFLILKIAQLVHCTRTVRQQ